MLPGCVPAPQATQLNCIPHAPAFALPPNGRLPPHPRHLQHGAAGGVHCTPLAIKCAPTPQHLPSPHARLPPHPRHEAAGGVQSTRPHAPAFALPPWQATPTPPASTAWSSWRGGSQWWRRLRARGLCSSASCGTWAGEPSVKRARSWPWPCHNASDLAAGQALARKCNLSSGMG